MLSRLLIIVSWIMEFEMSTEFQDTVGVLHPDIPAKLAGRKVAEWKYQFPDLESHGRPILIPITVLMTYKHKRVSFTAVSERLPDELQHSDINELYNLVFDALEDQARVLTRVEWQDWLEITVKGRTTDNLPQEERYRALLAGELVVEVNRIKWGVHPETGLPLTINSNGVAVPFPEPTRISDTANHAGGRPLSEPKERSYVPATAENIQALKIIIERMEMLRSGLSDILSHDNVGASPDIGDESLYLLPSP